MSVSACDGQSFWNNVVYITTHGVGNGLSLQEQAPHPTGLCSVLRPRQHSIGWETVFTVQKTNQQYQSTEGHATKEKAKNENN